MRTRLIASLVSLSLANGYGVQAQEALWFTPSPPTVIASEPTTTAAEQSFARRFGGLLSKPAGQTNTATNQGADQSATTPPHSTTAAAQPRLSPTVAGQPSGARDFRIPWSRTTRTAAAESPVVSPAAPSSAATTASSTGSSTASSTGSSTASSTGSLSEKSPSTVSVVPWATVPAHRQVPGVAQFPGVAQLQTLAAWPAEHAPVPAKMVAVTSPAKALPTSAAPPSPRPPVQHPATQPPAPQSPSIWPSPQSELAESLIQPVPVNKLTPPLPRVEWPVTRDPWPEARDIVTAPPQIQVVQPNYVLIDTQQSASDRGAPAAEPVPAITNRLTDQLEARPPVIEPNNSPALVPPPSLAAPAIAAPPARVAVPDANSSPLLTTESMIGPLQGAESLFNRLEIEHDLRDVAARIDSGPRGDVNNYAWMPAAYTWISPAFYHHPLYFEQPNLERYGIGTHRALQPLASSIHFFGSIPLVPYKTLTHHPREKVYTLGNMRPGNYVPVQRGVVLGQSHVGEVMMYWQECSGY